MSNPDLKHRAFSPCEFQESFAKICARHRLSCSAPNILSASLVERLMNTDHVVDIDNFADKCKLKRKTLNPYTNKCVKKCPKGFVRKKKPKSQTRKKGLFKCVKKGT